MSNDRRGGPSLVQIWIAMIFVAPVGLGIAILGRNCGIRWVELLGLAVASLMGVACIGWVVMMVLAVGGAMAAQRSEKEEDD
jgi:hypothetical protein